MTRTLSGTPTGSQTATTYSYTVSDADTNTGADDTATLSFRITVHMADQTAARVMRAWTARFGRTIGTHITDAVSARLREDGAAESHLTVAGWRMPLGSRERQDDATRQASGYQTGHRPQQPSRSAPY